MKIIVVGGSNSQRAAGYQTHIRAAHPDISLLNLSVGAAPSLMAIYRLLTSDKIVPGDLLIWEYALNDLNHIAHKGYDPQLLLRYVEYTLRFALEKGLVVLPLILVPQRVENGRPSDPYRDGLRALFDHYGLNAVDISSHLRKTLGQPRVPPEFYSDVNHYEARDEFLAPILAALSETLADPSRARPRSVSSLIAPQDRIPTVHAQADQGQLVPFSNKMAHINAWSPSKAPVIFNNLPAGADLVGLLVIASSTGGAMRLRAGDVDVTLSLCHDERKFGKPLLKLIALPNLLPSVPRLGQGDTVQFDVAQHDANTLCDMGFRPLKGASPEGEDGLIVALLIEETDRS